MTFTVPLFLLATLAAAIPVILHMINRQRAKDLPFSTLRFLKISVQKTRRKRRIHDLLLMLIRAALLILLALGLARPTMTNLGSLLGGGASSAVAIILDNSASMGVIDQGRSRFETALGAAGQILDQLEDGDQVSLWLTGGPDFPDEGRLDRTREKVTQILQQAAVSYQKADLGTSVQQARNVLLGSDAPNKQIYVISDMQAISWEALVDDEGRPSHDEAALTDQERKLRQIPVILVDCQRSPKPNVAVTDVTLESAVPVAGLPVRCVAEIYNASPVEQQRHVELYVDGSKEGASPALKIPAGERVKHSFQFVLQRGGLHRGEVRLSGDDGSKFDDQRFFTLEVDQGIPVAIVKPQRHEIPYLEETFYVEQALSPGKKGGWAITTTSLEASALLSEPLSNFKVIYLVNLPALESEAAVRLRDYVSRGGHLVWLCGDNVAAEAYNEMNEAAENKLLPAPLAEIRAPEKDSGRDSWNITYLDKQHPALRQLSEPASLYQSVLVYKHARMKLEQGSPVRVLARLDDGEPLVVERKIDDGSVIMIGTSGHVGWTNFPLRPIFLPLLARLTFDLAGAEQARHSGVAGAPLVLEFGEEIPPSAVEVQPPSGATIRLSTVDDDGNRAKEFRYAETHEVGVYLLRLLEGVRPVQLAYSINPDPEEPDSRKLPRSDLEPLFAGTPLVFADNPDDLSSTFDWLREGKSLWEMFLTAVLVALVFEAFLSNRLTPKHDEATFATLAPGTRRLARKGRRPIGPQHQPA